MEPSNPWTANYAPSTLMRLFGITRTALRYYEKVGLVSPSRADGSNWRSYTPDDATNIYTYIVSRNVAAGTANAREVMQHDVDAPAFFAGLLRDNADTVRYHEAVGENLRYLNAVVSPDDAVEPHLVLADSWSLYYDGCEEGIDGFIDDEHQAVLLAAMPVALFGAAMSPADDGSAASMRYGRIVRERHLAVLGSSLEEAESLRLGGCPCLRWSTAVPVARLGVGDSDVFDARELRRALDRHGLVRDGLPFTVGFPYRDQMFFNAYLPVRPVGVGGRLSMALRGLPNERDEVVGV